MKQENGAQSVMMCGVGRMPLLPVHKCDLQASLISMYLLTIGDQSQRILLDNVECFGTEASLTICSHKGIGEHNLRTTDKMWAFHALEGVCMCVCV